VTEWVGRAHHYTTPFEFVHKAKPNIKDLHEFGATVYVKDLTAGKLDVQAKIRKFMGYDDESKGYRIYWPEKRSVGIEREVRFNPDKVLIPDDKLGNEGEWPTLGDSSSVTNPTPTPPAPPIVEPALIPVNNPPRLQEPPAEPISQPRLPDGLTPPEPNTGQGHRARPTPGHYARMNRGDISEEVNAAIEFLDDDDHALFCAVASLPEDEDEPEFALASEPGDEPSWNEALTQPREVVSSTGRRNQDARLIKHI
jgi:hypothetical protein